jgi:hypothetical protein
MEAIIATIIWHFPVLLLFKTGGKMEAYTFL